MMCQHKVEKTIDSIKSRIHPNIKSTELFNSLEKRLTFLVSIEVVSHQCSSASCLNSVFYTKNWIFKASYQKSAVITISVGIFVLFHHFNI